MTSEQLERKRECTRQWYKKRRQDPKWRAEYNEAQRLAYQKKIEDPDYATDQSERKRQYQLDPQHKARARATAAERHQADPRKRMFYGARHRAKTANLPYSLTLDDIIIPKVCPWLGVELEISVDGAPQDSSPTLDRIIPELGYVSGNVEVISGLANRMKSSGTFEQIVAMGQEAQRRLGVDSDISA